VASFYFIRTGGAVKRMPAPNPCMIAKRLRAVSESRPARRMRGTERETNMFRTLALVVTYETFGFHRKTPQRTPTN